MAYQINSAGRRQWRRTRRTRGRRRRSSGWSSRTACRGPPAAPRAAPAIACSGSSRATWRTKSPEPFGGGLGGDALCALVEFGAQPLDGARREAARDDLAQPGVLGASIMIIDEPAGLDLPARRRHRCSAARPSSRRREHVAAQRHLADVAVLAHHPVAAVAETARRPGGCSFHQIGAAASHLGELLGRQPLRVDVGIGEVESGRQVRARRGREEQTGSCGPPRAGFRDGNQRSCITVAVHGRRRCETYARHERRFPRRRDDDRRGGTGRARRAQAAGREPRRRGERRRPLIPGPGGDVPVRVYRPHGTADARPAVVFAHGGGFVLCDLDSHDSFCRAMSRHTETVVVSVDYRLAPEHRAPAAAEDVFAAWCWAIEHADELGVDPPRVLIAGDSAGGNLAAVTALMCRERGRADARRAAADLSGHRAVLRHRELSQVLDADTSTPATRCSTTGGSTSTTRCRRRSIWWRLRGPNRMRACRPRSS